MGIFFYHMYEPMKNYVASLGVKHVTEYSYKTPGDLAAEALEKAEEALGSLNGDRITQLYSMCYVTVRRMTLAHKKREKRGEFLVKKNLFTWK